MYHHSRMKVREAARPIGRPRAFDKDKALNAALQVFWRKGYEGASLSDLTEAMGINRPSLYAAFGDKEALFRGVLDRYGEGPASYVAKALNEPTARQVVQRLLYGVVDQATNPRNPPGCLLVQGGLACGDDSQSIRDELSLRRDAGQKALQKRLRRAKSEGDLPPGSDPSDLARFIVTIVRGLGVQAADGASREELRRVVQIALRAWPE